jgi:hypothetical protein
VIVVAVDVNAQKIKITRQRERPDKIVDVVAVNKRMMHAETAGVDLALEASLDGGHVGLGTLEPSAGPPLLEQAQRVVFQAVGHAEFEKFPVRGADAPEDFREDPVLVILGINLESEALEPKGVRMLDAPVSGGEQGAICWVTIGEIVDMSVKIRPGRAPSMMPFLPSATCSTSGELGSIVMRTSHGPATSRGEPAALAPCPASSSTGGRLRLWTTSEYPALRRFLAMGRPMIPSPMNPITCAMGPPRGGVEGG